MENKTKHFDNFISKRKDLNPNAIDDLKYAILGVTYRG